MPYISYAVTAMVRNLRTKPVFFGSLLFLSLKLAVGEAPCAANIDEGALVFNYTNFAPLVRDSQPVANNPFYEKYYKNPRNPEEARDLLSLLYGKSWIRKAGSPEGSNTNCVSDMKRFLKEKAPNVYIYVGGFGRHVQLNDQYIDAAEVVKWINGRDPEALVISLGWSCKDAVANGKDWCRQKALEYAIPDDHVIFKELRSRTQRAPSKQFWGQLRAAGAQFGTDYNESLAHSLEMAGHLVNLLLTASSDHSDPDRGKIHFIGYSLGAQMVTEIMSFDYDAADGREGFPWFPPQSCNQRGERICRVSELKKVKWALALGSPGWTPALRNSLNKFDEFSGRSQRSAQERDEFENGGLFRIADSDFKRFLPGGASAPRSLRYQNKLVVFNKRYDPTSVADDTYQRGVGSSLLNEYNHYGHDYNRPYFWNKTWVSTIEKYLENPSGKNSLEWGVIWEAGANYDFDDCTADRCHPTSNYAYHPFGMQSHAGLEGMKPKDSVRTLLDVSSGNRVLALEGNQDRVLQAYAMDQEDLRGSVEFSWKPRFDVSSRGTRGLFSYGSCEGSRDDLMPQAYVENGELVFELKYQERNYSVSVGGSELTSRIHRDEWSHVSFGWDFETKTLLESRDRESAARAYGDAFFFAAGLLRAPRSSMRKQEGPGRLKIWINGQVVAEKTTEDLSRDCLGFRDVISSQTFDLLSGLGLPAYNPFTGYTGDALANGLVGKTCKAYRVRNSPVYFGCAKSANVTAASQMDNVRIIFGSPRSKFPEIHPGGGLPKPWTEVLEI